MTTKRLVKISYFTMLTIIGGLIRIPVPFTPITVTLQTLFVAASGLMLGAKDGAFSQIAYMLLGLIGIPVFTAGGGPSYIFQPSFGYIVGFPLQAFLTGLLVSKQKTLSTFKLFLCAAAGVIAGYIIGMTYQVIILVFVSHWSVKAAFLSLPSVCVMLVKDFVLVYLLCLLYPRIKTLIGKANERIQKRDEAEQTPPPLPKEGGEGENKDPEPVNKNPEPVTGEA